MYLLQVALHKLIQVQQYHQTFLLIFSTMFICSTICIRKRFCQYLMACEMPRLSSIQFQGQAGCINVVYCTEHG